jgi:hypothetical protein
VTEAWRRQASATVDKSVDIGECAAALLAHDPEKLQTFRTKIMRKIKKFGVRSDSHERIAL